MKSKLKPAKAQGTDLRHNIVLHQFRILKRLSCFKHCFGINYHWQIRHNPLNTTSSPCRVQILSPKTSVAVYFISVSNYKTEAQKFSCTRSFVKINKRIQVKTWICSGWVFIWSWRVWQQQSILLGSILHACSYQQSQLVLDVSMRNLWAGTQKKAVGRATSPTELDQHHDKPWFISQVPVVLETHKVCYHHGNPCWKIKHVSEVLEHPLICRLMDSKPVYPSTSAGLKYPFWTNYYELPKKQ